MDGLKVRSFTTTAFSTCLLKQNDQDVVNQAITNPDLAPLLAIVKAARNGAVYGAKVRFPHALV